MSVLLEKKQPQTYTFHGVKFFKKHLDKIRLDSMVTDHPITTSEIAVFMILHLYADEMGQIRSFTTDPSVSERKQLCISNLSIEHDLTYETVKKAFDKLLERNYIAEVYTDKGMHYEIVDYAKYNHQIKDHITGDQSSYFRIPLALFEEKIFGPLIRHRFHKGPILLLELCQYFTVQLGTNRRNVENIEEISGIRTMSYLKKALNTTAKRVRQFLSIINNIFPFQPIKEKIKQPSQGRTCRRRTFIQVCVDEYKFRANGLCFKQNERSEERKNFARYRKEMAARIKYAKIPVKWRDIKDIERSISRMVKTAKHLNVVGKTEKMLDFTISKVADQLEELHKTGNLNAIKSIGAYVNKCFTNVFNEFLKVFITVEERLKIAFEYHKIYGEYPPFFNKQ